MTIEGYICFCIIGIICGMSGIILLVSKYRFDDEIDTDISEIEELNKDDYENF